MSCRVAKSMLSIMTAAGTAAREIIATISCSRLSAPLYFLIIKYVDKLPRPMPDRIRYWYNVGKAAIAAKGPAQQIPLSAFAPAGHFAQAWVACPKHCAKADKPNYCIVIKRNADDEISNFAQKRSNHDGYRHCYEQNTKGPPCLNCRVLQQWLFSCI
jgi:hypothetical protein